MDTEYITLDHKEAENFKSQDYDVFVDGYAVIYKKKEVNRESKID